MNIGKDEENKDNNNNIINSNSSTTEANGQARYTDTRVFRRVDKRIPMQRYAFTKGASCSKQRVLIGGLNVALIRYNGRFM